jgi:hypothetical protein
MVELEDIKELLRYISNTDDTLCFLNNFCKNNNKVMSKFIDKNKGFGKEMIYEYIIFQLNYWDFGCTKDRYSSNGIFIVPFNNIFAIKALKRWKDKQPHWLHFNHKFCKERGLRLNWILPRIVNVSEVEEKERSRFFNTELGFVNCQEYCQYNEYSSFCHRCKFSRYCKKDYVSKN